MRHLTNYVVLALITLIFFLSATADAQVGLTTEADKIQQARKYFENKNFEQALPLYSQIVSNHPDNAFYNYYLGVCLLKVDGDKADAVRFLTLASQSTDVPINCWLYLGMAQHQAYRFDEAIVTLQMYRQSAGKQAWKESQGDQLLQMCRNAIDLKNDLSLLRHSILQEQEISMQDFAAKYKSNGVAGRFLKLPKEYETKQSKDKPESALVYLTPNSDYMVYSAPGTNGSTGFDIFLVRKDKTGLWTFPESISPVVNTTSDEAYPVLVNNGKTIYFSSKGIRSTGGYDIFKSDYDDATSSWTEPIPMGSPVNSPGNDFYYFPAPDKSTAYFSSDRESASGKCNVYTASVINENRNYVTINGTFTCPAGLDLSDAKVTIFHALDRSLLAQFRTSTQNGDYFLKLPVPSKLIYMVKLPGFGTLEAEVEISGTNPSMLTQEILVKREKGKETIQVITKQPEAPAFAVSTEAQNNSSAKKPELDLISIVSTEKKDNSQATFKSDNEKIEKAAIVKKTDNAEIKQVEAAKKEEVAVTNSNPQVKTANNNSQTSEPLVSVVTKVDDTDKKVSASKTTAEKETTKTEPLVSIVNTSDPAEKSVLTNEQEPLVSVVEISSKEKNDIPVENITPTVNKPVAVQNNEVKSLPATELKTINAYADENALPLVSVVNTTPQSQSAMRIVTTEMQNHPDIKELFAPVVDPDPIASAKQENKVEEIKAVASKNEVAVVTTGTPSGQTGKDKKKKEKIIAAAESETTVVETPKPQITIPAETIVSVRPGLKDVIFKVQLGAFCDRSESELKKKFESSGIKNLEYIKNSQGFLVVVTGSENDYAAATKLKADVVNKGHKDAFIVVYSGDNRLPVSMVVFEEE